MVNCQNTMKYILKKTKKLRKYKKIILIQSHMQTGGKEEKNKI